MSVFSIWICFKPIQGLFRQNLTGIEPVATLIIQRYTLIIQQQAKICTLIVFCFLWPWVRCHCNIYDISYMYLLFLRLYLYLDVPVAVRAHDEIETALIIKRVLLLVATRTRCRIRTRIKSKPLYYQVLKERSVYHQKILEWEQVII